jgi:hypothetical protein
MSQLNVKAAEKEVFQLSNSRDGLYDIFLGTFIILMSTTPWLDENGLRTPWNIAVVEIIGLAILLGVLALKKWVVVPRIGQVKFGTARQKRIKRLGLGMAGIFIITLILFGLTIRAIYFGQPLIAGPLKSNFPLDIVHTGAGIFIFGIFSVIAHMRVYPRMYFYGFIFGLGYVISTTLQDITGNSFYWPWAAAGLIAAGIGLILFIRFLKEFPPRFEGIATEL